MRAVCRHADSLTQSFTQYLSLHLHIVWGDEQHMCISSTSLAMNHFNFAVYTKLDLRLISFVHVKTTVVAGTVQKQQIITCRQLGFPHCLQRQFRAGQDKPAHFDRKKSSTCTGPWA